MYFIIIGVMNAEIGCQVGERRLIWVQTSQFPTPGRTESWTSRAKWVCGQCVSFEDIHRSHKSDILAFYIVTQARNSGM